MDTATTIAAFAPGWALLKAMIQGWRQRRPPAPAALADACAALRARADSHRHTDPAFAADLDAAAARSEAQHAAGRPTPPVA